MNRNNRSSHKFGLLHRNECSSVNRKNKTSQRWVDGFAVVFLLLAEELPAVPAVVASLSKGEANRAAGAAVNHLVLHPVIGG